MLTSKPITLNSMAKRFTTGSVHPESNRRQRKRRFISLKNKMRKYPDCAYDGDFYCNHVYDPAQPWVWVDFRFHHSKLKRYFSVAMTTLEFSEMEKDDEKAYELTRAELGDLRNGIEKQVELSTHGKCYVFVESAEEKDFNRNHIARQVEIGRELMARPRQAQPSIIVKDYGKVVIGLWVTVDRPYIDPTVIREFIAEFRKLGEPTTPGWTWTGPSVEVIPANLETRKNVYTTS